MQNNIVKIMPNTNVNNYANKNGIVKVFLGEVFNKVPVNLHFLKELKFVMIISKKIRV